MGDPMIISFSPPFLTSQIRSVRSQVLATIPSYETKKCTYFIDSLYSLVEYACCKNKQKQNFSLSIGFFNPKNINEDRIWSNQNVWVKVRVTGGHGNAFKSRYMATHCGVRRVDWKRDALHKTKTASVKAAAFATKRAISHVSSGILEFVADEVVDGVERKIAKKMDADQRKRAFDRFHQYDADTILKLEANLQSRASCGLPIPTANQMPRILEVYYPSRASSCLPIPAANQMPRILEVHHQYRASCSFPISAADEMPYKPEVHHQYRASCGLPIPSANQMPCTLEAGQQYLAPSCSPIPTANQMPCTLEAGEPYQASSRLDSVSYSAEYMFSQLYALTAADLNMILANGKIWELSRDIFGALGRNNSGTLDFYDFLIFWHKLLNQRIGDALSKYEEVAGSANEINFEQFTYFFANILQLLTSGEEPKHYTMPKQMNEAKSLIVELYKLSAVKVQQILASEDDFIQFAAKVFNDINDYQFETIDKQEFLKFFSSALEIPVEQAYQAFQAGAGTGDVIYFNHFSAYLHNLLSAQLMSRNNSLVWTRLVNQWMCMDLEELVELQNDRKAAGVLAEKLFEIVNATGSGLTYEQFEYLEMGLSRALSESPETKEERILRFQAHAFSDAYGRTLISIENYIEIIFANLGRVIQFKVDWDFAQIFNDAIFRLGDDVDQMALEKFYARFYYWFTPNKTLTYWQYAGFARCLHITSMSQTFELNRDIVFNLDKIIRFSIKTMKKTKNENAQFPGKHYFAVLAKFPHESLPELVLEDYRLHATAHFVFLCVHPYRPQHDYTTFMLYGQHLCAELNLQEQTVTEWFHLFAKNNFLSEDGLVMCLKQAIYQIVCQYS